MSKPPAFQLYAADFYMDTADWTCVQVGAYIRLLLYEWINGALPSGVSDLARIANIDRRTMAKMWTQKLAKKFQLNEAKMLVNPRLEEERRKQKEHREKQEKSGRKGGLRTQEKRRKESSEPSSEPSSENKPLQSSSSIIDLSKDKSIRVSKETLVPVPHQEIIEIYHRTLPELPSVKVWSDSRKRKLKARWNESKERQCLDWWEGYFQGVRDCPFLMGQKTDFRADLEWLIEAGNMPKVLDGRYRESEGGNSKWFK